MLKGFINYLILTFFTFFSGENIFTLYNIGLYNYVYIEWSFIFFPKNHGFLPKGKTKGQVYIVTSVARLS